jgi:hypothetical protein
MQLIETLSYKSAGCRFETPATLGSGVYSTSNKNEYQKQKKMRLWSRVRLVLKADNLTAISGLIG